MEVFVELKKQFIAIGVKPNSKSNFNWLSVIIVLLLAWCFVGMSEFLLLEAKTMIDIGNSFYGAVCAALNILTYPSNVLKRNKIFDVITRFEDIINKREKSVIFT